MLTANKMTTIPRPLQGGIQTLDLLLLLILAALWGGSYLFVRIAGPALGPIVLMALRVSLAVVALCLYGMASRNLPDFRQRWWQFLILGVLNNAIPFTLIASAVINLNASVAAILNATTPLFTAVIAALWAKEEFGVRKGLGVLLGLFGVFVLVGWSPLPLTEQTLWATGAALLAAISYGAAAVYARLTFKGVAPLHTAIGQLAGSSLLLVPLALINPPAVWPTSAVLWAVLGLALICTSVAYLLYFRLIANAGATPAATVTFLIPFFSVLWGVTFLGEPLNLGMFVGLGVILFSVWLVLGARK